MRFVAPEPVRINLKDSPDGSVNWIDVRKFLSAGEQISQRTAGFKRVSQGDSGPKGTPDISIDFAEMAFARVNAYLIGWSDKRKINDADKRADAIRALDPDDFDEIDKAILAHIEKMEEAKNAPTPSSSLTAV